MTTAVLFRPTATPAGYPSTCLCCGRHATGIGVGTFKADPQFLCEQCWPILEYIRSIRSFNAYEVAAVEKAVEAVGPFIEKNGSDLSTWEADQAEEFVRAIWVACGDSLRTIIKSNTVPF